MIDLTRYGPQNLLAFRLPIEPLFIKIVFPSMVNELFFYSRIEFSPKSFFCLQSDCSRKKFKFVNSAHWPFHVSLYTVFENWSLEGLWRKTLSFFRNLKLYDFFKEPRTLTFSRTIVLTGVTAFPIFLHFFLSWNNLIFLFFIGANLTENKKTR